MACDAIDIKTRLDLLCRTLGLASTDKPSGIRSYRTQHKYSISDRGNTIPYHTTHLVIVDFVLQRVGRDIVVVVVVIDCVNSRKGRSFESVINFSSL